MKSKTRKWLATAMVLTTMGVGSQAYAVPLFRSGGGAWDTVTANWGTASGGPYNVAAWSNGTPDSAVFEGTAGTVTLSTDINIQNLTFSVPNAVVAGYFIGDTTENNTLNFSGTKTITLNATVTGTNQDMTIRAGITGSPTLNIAGRLNNSQFFALEPTANVTMTLGTLNMTNTNASNKQLRLGGNSLGNVVDQITWTVTANQLQVRKQATTNSGADATSWTINQNLSLDDGKLFVDEGTLILNGTNNFISHAVQVNAGGRIVAQGNWRLNDEREDFQILSGGIVAPGQGVKTLAASWNNVGNSTGMFDLQNGSIYEWEVGPSATDIIDVQRGNSDSVQLTIGNMTLKILDAGGTPIALDQLAVFTYGTGVTRSIGNVTFDTSALGSTWAFNNLSLVDNGQGTIFLTGLSNVTAITVPEPATATLALLGLGGLMMRRRRDLKA